MKKFFEEFPEIFVALSEKTDGSMKIFEDERNEENRIKFFKKIGIDPENVVSANLANRTSVAVIENNKQNIIDGTDALVSKNINIALSITVADCIPVFFFEPEEGIIAISHCGWRGIVGGIIKNTLEKIKELGGNAENLKVALGPGINACHFEIGKDVLSEFAEYEKYIIKKEDKIFTDLKGILQEQLKSLGIKEENIENDEECTFESNKYFSYRRNKPKNIEAMIAVIGFNG